MSYATTHTHFARSGDVVTPIRVTKQWVEPLKGGKGRKFIPVRSTVVGFGKVNQGPEDWRSTQEKPMDRGALIAAGLIRPECYGEPCLELDDPAGWTWAVCNNPLPPWSDPDPYEISTDAE